MLHIMAAKPKKIITLCDLLDEDFDKNEKNTLLLPRFVSLYIALNVVSLKF